MKKIMIVLALAANLFAETSIDELQKACDGGNTLGCVMLGAMYEEGKGVKQDYLKAAELYKKACDGGNARGCGWLGMMHEEGEGVKQNKSKAKELYGKACDMKLQLVCEQYKRLNEAGY